MPRALRPLFTADSEELRDRHDQDPPAARDCRRQPHPSDRVERERTGTALLPVIQADDAQSATARPRSPSESATWRWRFSAGTRSLARSAAFLRSVA